MLGKKQTGWRLIDKASLPTEAFADNVKIVKLIHFVHIVDRIRLDSISKK